MTNRELFRAIMHYGDFDRMPVMHWTGWPETAQRWEKEGMPAGADQNQFLGVPPLTDGVPINLGLFPLFEEEVIEETDEYVIKRQNDGVVAQLYKGRSSIPHYIDFLLKDPSGWDAYKKRLQPDPGRLPEDFDAHLDRLAKSEHPVSIGTASMVGWLRNWMGVENMAMASMMHQDFFAETVDVISDLVCWAIDLVGPRLQIDLGWGWEDICFRTGPLIHPQAFKELCVPGYRKISDKLLEYGCDLHLTDCDGMIEHLIPHWLEGGVNVMFPIEIGSWNADPHALRKKFGKEMRVFGGINKLVLEGSREEIDAEIERRRPIMAEGGFVPIPDHLITPGTSLDNYRYYLDRMRELRF